MVLEVARVVGHANIREGGLAAANLSFQGLKVLIVPLYIVAVEQDLAIEMAIEFLSYLHGPQGRTRLTTLIPTSSGKTIDVVQRLRFMRPWFAQNGAPPCEVI